jgi:hypothetical protein
MQSRKKSCGKKISVGDGQTPRGSALYITGRGQARKMPIRKTEGFYHPMNMIAYPTLQVAEFTGDSFGTETAA